MNRDELERALEQQDWDSVLKHGAVLYGQASCEERDAVGNAVDAALFLLEHPEFDALSPELARITKELLL